MYFMYTFYPKIVMIKQNSQTYMRYMSSTTEELKMSLL